MLRDLNARKAVLLSLIIVLVMLTVNTARQWPRLMAGDLSNPDSYARLVLLQDWQADAGYQFMPRDGAPEGSYLHWSMLHTWTLQQLVRGLHAIGLPSQEAMLLAGGALTQASVFLLCLFVALAITAVGGRLATIATVLALVLSRGLLAYGQLIQITHHVFMLVPLAAAAWLVFRTLRMPGEAPQTLRHPPGALFTAGVCMGLSLWISPETMPLIAGLAAVQAGHRLQFAQDSPCWPVAAGLCLLLTAGWWVDPPPPTFEVWSLDHLSLAWLAWAAALAASLLAVDAIAGLTRVPLAGKAVLAVSATLVFAGLWLTLTPGALAGPIGLLPDELRTLWWGAIKELRPTRKGYEIIGWLSVPTLAGLLLLHGAWRQRRLWWAVLALTALAYAALTAWHMRMGTAAAVVGALAWGVWLAGRDAFRSPNPNDLPQGVQLRATALLLVPVLVTLATVGSAALELDPDKAVNKTQQACTLADIAAPLDALAPTTVLIALNDAPELLWRTHHRVIAGNYHHNTAGILDSFHIWRATGDERNARAIIARRDIRLLLVCANVHAQGDTLAQRLARGATPTWLRGPEILGHWYLYRVAAPDTGPAVPADTAAQGISTPD